MTRGPKPNRLSRESLLGLAERLKPAPECEDKEAFMRHWNDAVAAFAPEHFSRCDRALLEVYCKLAVRFEQAERRLDEEGLVVEGTVGPKANPLIGIMTGISRQMTTMARSLRITPSSRMQHNSAKAIEDMPPDGDTSNDHYSPGIRMVG